MSHRLVRFRLAALLACGSVITAPRPARADLFGADVAELAAILAELVTQGLTMFSQLQQLRQQVSYAEQNIRRLDPRTFQGTVDYINQVNWSYQSLAAQLQSVSFTANQLQADFNRLFPRDRRSWQSVRHSEFANLYTSWQAQITSSSQIAMLAQTHLGDIQRQNQMMVQVLSQSSGADGAVKQLQLVNQSLGLIYTRLGTMLEVLGTGQRVTGSLAAAAAGEKLMIRESKQRRLEGYTNRGRAPRTLPRLP